MRSTGWAPHTSLQRELAGWNRLSLEVNSYVATIDDYTNDVCSRDYVAQVMSDASDTLRAEIEEHVVPADERFLSSTVVDDDDRIGRYHRVDLKDGWWWRRRPAAGPLAQYLDES